MTLPTSRLRLRSQTPEPLPVIESFGSSAGRPADIGEQITAGPLHLTVSDVVAGPEATEEVVAASPRNQAPADGFAYVVAGVELTNAGDRPVIVDNDDFGFVTSARQLRRAIEIEAPEPALKGTIGPGETLVGNVAGLVEDGDETILLVFNCRDLGGRWSERFIALVDGSSIRPPDASSVEANRAGADVAAPALIGETVATADWAVTLHDVVAGQAVFDLFPTEDFRTRALGSASPENVTFWLGLRFAIQNNRGAGSALHFPVDAFQLAYDDGAAVPDVRILSSPLPDLSGQYLPGGGAEGWITFELPIWFTGDVVRFQPFRTDADIRFLTWGEGSAEPVPVESAEPDQSSTLSLAGKG